MNNANNNTMTTILNNTGSKAVNIRKQEFSVSAMYVQIYNGHEQVLQAKTFTNEKNAINWANKKLN